MRNFHRSMYLAVGALLFLGGCSGNGLNSDLGDGGTSMSVPFSTFVRGGSPGDGPQAGLDGQLLLEGECLVVADATTGAHYGLVFPNEATWDEETETVRVDDVVLTVGETVSLGGGFRHREDALLTHTCISTEEIFSVFNVESLG